MTTHPKLYCNCTKDLMVYKNLNTKNYKQGKSNRKLCWSLTMAKIFLYKVDSDFNILQKKTVVLCLYYSLSYSGDKNIMYSYVESESSK